MMAEPGADFAEALAGLTRAYLEHLPEDLAALREIVAQPARGEAARPALTELYQGLHRLAGSGGTFGLKAMSESARTLEKTVKGWLAGDLASLDEGLWSALSSDIAALSALTQAAKGVEADSVAPTVSADVARRAPVVQEGCLIWLVEDDVALGDELARLLSQFGYEVRLFHRFDEAEAATVAGTGRPGALILDVSSPAEGGNATGGLEDCPALRALGCPLLFISAESDFHARMRAAHLGAAAFLAKPLDIPRLVDRLEAMFNARQNPPYRVMIVDDDERLAEHYRMVLSAAGMEVDVLARQEEIIDHVAAFGPELILMDMHMPGHSGPELATVIRYHDEWIGLPIVYLSAETDLDAQISALGRGADDFLTKPISDAQLVTAVEVRAARFRQLADLMSKDSLTGLLKHSRIKEVLNIEVTRARRSGKPVSVVMLDIDHFKAVNDSYGHATGDQVIKALSHLLRQRLRQTDGIGRYGGEEFVAVLPECGAAAATRMMDDIRERFSRLSFQHEGKTFAVTLSCGLADSDAHPLANAGELLIKADGALYAAKAGGRNRVCVAATPSPVI